MLFPRQTLERIAAGEVTIAFRRWRRPTVKAGGRLRTAIGELAILSVEQISESAITPADAARAGYGSVDELRTELASRPEGELYRVTFTRAGDDPRIALRSAVPATQGELDAAVRQLRRLDRDGWYERALRAIDRQPGTVASVLAAQFGMETLQFKQRVRRLKELGFTESLPVGYRLSPRGAAVLRHCGVR